MSARPLVISPTVILGAANIAPEAVALLIVTPEKTWSSACAALERAAEGAKIGLFIEALRFYDHRLRDVRGIPKPFAGLLALRDKSRKQRTMPSLLSVARLSLIKRSVALRPPPRGGFAFVVGHTL